jgi:SRSO17 transposase
MDNGADGGLEQAWQAERGRLGQFLEEMLAGLGRKERRRWGAVYVRGLLATSERKTAARMAAQLPDGEVQALQQFVGQSPWDWEPVRAQLAQRMARELQPVAAWVVDDTGFPKKGDHSVGVARQYSGTLGKVGNCQVAVSLHYATDDAAIPLDFQLYLPEEWFSAERRREAAIPDDVTFKTKGDIALDLIDQALSWAIPSGVVAADAGYGNRSAFRLALAARKLQYAVGIDGSTTVWSSAVWPEGDAVTVQGPAERRPRGRPRRVPAELPAPLSAHQLAQALPTESWRSVTWREGSKGPMTSRFAAVRVRPAHGYRHGEEGEEGQWLLVEWLAGQAAPSRYWLSSLPPTMDLASLVRIAKIRWWIEQGYQQLKDELGLDHYEGRRWQGWHHHVTLTMLAFAFLSLERLRGKKNFWAALTPADDPA